MADDTGADVLERGDPQVRASELVRRSGTSFRWSMRILPKPRRDAMYAVYGFCRVVDDIVDNPGEREDQARRLQEWRAEIARLYAGEPGTAIGRALLEPVRAYDLPRDAFLAVIDGMEMDLNGVMRGPSQSELETYCQRVAGAVGRLSLNIFGADEPEAPEIARCLGEALQLTNILRDLTDDAAMDRLYLPREMLRAHGIESVDPREVMADPALPQVCKDLAVLAHRRFDESRALIARCNRRRLKPCILMIEVYHRVLERLERRGWQNLQQPVRVSRPEKLWIALRHGLV